MASVMRVACKEEGDGNGGKSDGNEGGGRAAVTRVAMAMVTATVTRCAICSTVASTHSNDFFKNEIS